MDAATLAASMSYPGYPAPLSLSRYAQLVAPCEQALTRAHCTTPARVSMFLAQIGAESGSLRWTQELADGQAYNWRADLGNTQPGDGPRFKGRSFIQITGRYHYGALSDWAHRRGYVPSAGYFVDHPERLAADQFAFLGPVYYWTVARNMNAYADRHDIAGATYAVNGGYNNLAGRTARWNKCLSLGSAVLPETPGGPSAMQPYKCDGKYYLLQDGARVRRIRPDLAEIYAALGGRPIGTITAAAHQRIVANQVAAAKGK